MIEQSPDSVDNQKNESSENKLEEIVSEINKSIPEDVKGLDTSQLEDIRKELKGLSYRLLMLRKHWNLVIITCLPVKCY